MRYPNWYRTDKGEIRFYKAWNLDSTGLVKHGFSTRSGGASSEPYKSLNLSLNVEDSADSVLENRRRYSDALGIDFERIVVPDQVHSDNVRLVTAEDAGRGASDHSKAISQTDALITNSPGITLALHFADCCPVFLLDPTNKAVGMAHAGFKGTNSKIVSKTIDWMISEFGTDPADIQAAIGPCICRSCYDVGEDVASMLYKSFEGDERVIKQSSTSKWRVDLKTANYLLLRQAGVPESRIAVNEECTSCNSSELYSYRREGLTGRMGGWICLGDGA